ncbi:FAD/FMN-containing dehydrogenase [Kribbella orskensis]|uniref:FAD/FMN-containing dehydrogenase n=1 Tax=Kribbella orskensis TaxID=2512216 RepID=A0ABY2BSS8_9ACTN|nr:MULTISPECIES: FAD-binding oxidoreductase [Kribbella]TCN37310.1 FAD/FMN-containing dehydrogenase [Kribbella sp. VKM Ac-2500]TCO27782.1 FAD/FMN-containing dehydrogenase [Kribbella orskensis]
MTTKIEGPVWTKETDGYEEERLGFQRLAPHQPERIVGATTPQDVRSAVRYALKHGLKVAARASGHGHTRPLDGGLLITTGRLDAVTVDPENQTAWIQAGATWKQVIDATTPHGLAPLSGSFPGVGAIPYTLGGGLGLMARRFGFAADHVRRIEIVTPDGELRNAEEDPDLFWALRGGGGNFGIVTGLEIDLFPVTTLYGGSLYYDLNQAPGVLDTWREWTRTVPDEVTSAVAVLVFPDIPPVPEPLRGKHVAQLQLSVLGAGQELVQTLRELGKPLLDTVGELPYTESGRIFAEPERPDAYRSHNVLLNTLDAEALATIPKLAGPSAEAMCVIGIRHLGGALAQPPAIPNAVSHRDAAYSLTVLSPGKRDVTARHQRILEPWTDHVIGRFLNFSFAPLDQEETRAAFDPPTYERLTKLKTHYDPHHLLQPNHPVTGQQ